MAILPRPTSTARNLESCTSLLAPSAGAPRRTCSIWHRPCDLTSKLALPPEKKASLQTPVAKEPSRFTYCPICSGKSDQLRTLAPSGRFGDSSENCDRIFSIYTPSRPVFWLGWPVEYSAFLPYTPSTPGFTGRRRYRASPVP